MEGFNNPPMTALGQPPIEPDPTENLNLTLTRITGDSDGFDEPECCEIPFPRWRAAGRWLVVRLRANGGAGPGAATGHRRARLQPGLAVLPLAHARAKGPAGGHQAGGRAAREGQAAATRRAANVAEPAAKKVSSVK